MNRTHTLANTLVLIIAAGCSLSAQAFEGPQGHASRSKTKARISTTALWSDRGNMESLDLVNGPGGEAHKPSGRFTFVKEDKEGTSAKFDVVDDQGVEWKAKLGEEIKSETAATRLVWAAGYFTDEDYYIPELPVRKMAKLNRGNEYVSADGMVRGVRLERKVKGQKKSGNWNWFKNPYVGTKELNGLRIMMALINNWDLKEVNNAIYTEKSHGSRYAVSDLGASFGQTGNPLVRSKSNPAEYVGTPFIQKITAKTVDFHLSSRPFILTAVDVPNYIGRTHMQDVVKDIPVADARWLGRILGQLSENQLRDCFRGAGYSPEAVEAYTAVVKERIKDLNQL